MADGEQVSGRREALIKDCSPCFNKGTQKKAVNYCFVCETFFCIECTRQHNALLGNHRITEIESANLGVALSLQTEPCHLHGKALNLYCKGDDTIGCDICMSTDHGHCNDVIYLPRSAEEVIKDMDMDGIKAELRRLVSQLQSIRINQQATVSSLEADRATCLREIDEHHLELSNLLEQIVRSSKDKVEQTFKRLGEDLRLHCQKVDTCLADLEAGEKRIGRNQGNDVQLFVELKKCEKQLKTGDEVSVDSLDNLKLRGFSIVLDERLKNLFDELGSLVTVSHTQAPANLRQKYRVDVSCKRDTKICLIFGSCVLNDGSVLLVDHYNKLLKHLDQHSLNIVGQCPMPDSPIDLCCVNNNTVAVTVKTTIVLVSVKPHLTPVRTINLNHFCACVAFSQGELFINDENKTLYVHNVKGRLLRKVSKDPAGQDIFSRARHIVVSDAGDKVFVGDFDNGLVVLDRQGRVLYTHIYDNILGVRGLCRDGLGGIFVCGFETHNVVHVTAEGRILAEVLKSSDGLEGPMSLCYDRTTKRMFVSQYNRNELHVCEFE